MKMKDIPSLEEENLTRLRQLPLTLNGSELKGGLLSAFIASHFRREGILGDLSRFLADWQSPSATVPVQTSGSTGAPKPMQAEKRRMAQSARHTCAFLGLRPGDSALLAMPLRYIAGKMVVVRALVQGLNLVAVEPCSSPLREVGTPLDFAALTPMQAYESLRDPVCAERLRNVKHLLLGGGAVTGSLAAALRDFPNADWSSYAMTETLSHIALRKVNSQDATDWYTPMPSVSVHLSGKGTLVIDAPSVCEKVLTTNDIAEIGPDGRFRIRGRLDNVIDTGGIKVQAEEVEQKLAERIPGAFCITSVPDDRLGEKITLLHTSGMTDTELDALCRDVLPKYWVPRAFIRVEAIPLTGTGKTARADAKKLALSKYFPAG